MRTKTIKYLGFSAIILLAMACNTNKGNTTISGTVPEGEGPIYVSMIDAQKRIPLDTLEVTDGKFTYSFDSDSSDFYTLETSKQYYIPLFVNSGDKIKIELTGEEQDREYTISGSEESQRILTINDVVRNAMARIDSINTEMASSKDSADFMQLRIKLDTKFQSIVNDAQNSMKSLIDEKPGSIANLFIFSQTIGNFQLISPADDMPYYDKVIAGLEENYPGNEHTVYFKERAEKIREMEAMRRELQAVKESLVPGSPMKEIEMISPQGELKKLSDLKGKVVLVDFWAAWCRPCRAENPNLVRMYNDYKSKGFEVFSVSLDGLPQQPNPKQDWTAAIEQDGLIWKNHVSDLQGWTSSVVRQFGFQGIPYTILVDRDGNIIATELRGPALEAKLKEVLGV